MSCVSQVHSSSSKNASSGISSCNLSTQQHWTTIMRLQTLLIWRKYPNLFPPSLTKYFQEQSVKPFLAEQVDIISIYYDPSIVDLASYEFGLPAKIRENMGMIARSDLQAHEATCCSESTGCSGYQKCTESDYVTVLETKFTNLLIVDDALVMAICYSKDDIYSLEAEINQLEKIPTLTSTRR